MTVNEHSQYVWHVVLEQESDLLFSNQQVYPVIEQFMREVGLTYHRWPDIKPSTLTPEIQTEIRKLLTEWEPLGISGRLHKSHLQILSQNKADERVSLVFVAVNPARQIRVAEQYVNNSFASFFSTLYLLSSFSPVLIRFASAMSKSPRITEAVDPHQAFKVSELFRSQIVNILRVVRSCIDDIDQSAIKEDNNFWSEYLLGYEL